MISKELLSEVLGYVPFKVSRIKSVNGVGEKTLIIENNDGTVRAYWNIYELAHKCKEWASGYGYLIGTSFYTGDSINPKESICYIQGWFGNWLNIYVSEANTETEAIFNACQWLLDSKKIEKEN
jgi:hypothetical protein